MNFKHIFTLALSAMSFDHIQSNQKFVGKPAPLFNSPAVFPDGKIDNLNLEDYLGKKIVLYFYPMDNSPSCTIQAKKFRDEIDKLQSQGIMVIGISSDSIRSHQKFGEKLALPYPLIADDNKKHSIAKKYKTNGIFVGKRETFLINSKGIIFKVFDHVDIKNQINDILYAFSINT